MGMSINNFNPADEVRLLNIDVSTDLNVSRGTTGVSTATKEMSAISSAYIGLKTYLLITLCGLCICGGNAGGNSNINLKIERKEVGQAYSTLIQTDFSSSGNSSTETHSSITYPLTLTAGEKANGIQIQSTITITSNNNVSVTYTHSSTSVIAVK
jgi:hypothetical protein